MRRVSVALALACVRTLRCFGAALDEGMEPLDDELGRIIRVAKQGDKLARSVIRDIEKLPTGGAP